MTSPKLEAATRAAHDAYGRANSAWNHAVREALPTRWQLRHEYDFARAELSRLQRACAIELAASCGWKIYSGTKGWITISQLIAGNFHGSTSERSDENPGHVLDHRDCFTLERRPVAILSHSYVPWDACVTFARQRNLIPERLPFSWYYPERTIAVLFTRQP
ncbi:MAG TPA: hypothetical protein VK700_08765 [Steroidobacteraceae bacterium]|nr:hypothetical protein [Steroidobacteraceae bacterium]